MINNYEYSDMYKNSDLSGKAILIRKDLKSDTTKEFVIYEVIYNPFRETDVQFIFIKSMHLVNSNEIEIENENSEIYLFNVNTEKVIHKKIK